MKLNPKSRKVFEKVLEMSDAVAFIGINRRSSGEVEIIAEAVDDDNKTDYAALDLIGAVECFVTALHGNRFRTHAVRFEKMGDEERDG